MSIIPMMKKCPKCKKKYSWNPDVMVGLYCPHCAEMGLPPQTTLEEILRKNKEKYNKK